MTTETKIIGGIGIATVVAVILGAVLFSRPPAATSLPQVTESEKQYLVKSDSHQTNQEKGKIAVIEFADFQCPACGAAYPLVKKVVDSYGDQVNFVYRHFPLEIHKNAFPAAIASEAAAEQGKFWEMEDKLFLNQSKWEESDNPNEIFTGFAKDIGLDENKFKESIEAKKAQEKIQNDFKDGISLGVNSTPTFFINGKKLVGVPNENQLRVLIDEELKDK